jgi:trimethylamine--corrinoid protein Co-methyltransferase
LADYADFMRLGQAFNAIHLMAGSPVEPQDVPVPIRHLETLKLMLTLTDKVPFVFSQSRRRIADALEMIRIVHGCSMDELARRPVTYTVVNTNSPLQIDAPMLEGIIDLARMGQAVVVTPFTLAGAMAPVTLAGALAQQNAEALAGIAVGQFAKPGAPAVYGGFTTNVDMRSGAPTFGTPEYAKAAQISGQLARLNKLPFRSSNICSAVIPDAQAAYESVMATWAAVTGGANILLHGAGWLDGGLTASFEKFVMDIEILQMFAAYLQPEQVDAASLALDTVAEVGPGGHFFGTAHTLARYETAFYQPLLSDWRGHDAWREAGAVDATHRAHALYREALRDYEAPPMDAGVAEELEAFVARRKAEGGAPIT